MKPLSTGNNQYLKAFLHMLSSYKFLQNIMFSYENGVEFGVEI